MGGSPESANRPRPRGGLQRKRVAQACQTCRSMKSKCDGKWPECSRCLGYGYECVYTGAKRYRESADDLPEIPAHDQSELRAAIQQYEVLLGRTLDGLSDQDRNEAKSVLARLKAVESAQTSPESRVLLKPPVSTVASEALSNAASPWPGIRAERYLGEPSDVRFFNLVKQVLQTQLGSDNPDSGLASYEQEGDIASTNVVVVPDKVVQLPSLEVAKAFANVYFTTVHLAFPFIQQSSYMKWLHQALGLSDDDADNDNTLDTTKLAIIYVVCAIGAYYTSLPGGQTIASRSHEEYFLQALSLALPPGTDRSVDHVCLLLGQCFYLLAVSRTDSCWVTLGQTVRMAQSIGLHVEQPDVEIPTMPRRLQLERRRRVWYCIYVLDCLVSLQLGRPPAIHVDYFDVPLPSRVSDADIAWDGDGIPANFAGPSVGDYHLAVISFSKIISQVLQDLHSSKAGHDISRDLLNTKQLDHQLIQWKHNLPRKLRFDLGHTFDKCFIFKRQRSMFAIKYHHLRALLYRPYLCYPLLRNLDGGEIAFSQVDWPTVEAYEKTCITEARETARLLHSISSEKDLVQDFPWWQMIPCLVCAGSILVVSSAFIQQTQDVASEFDPAAISDDAETCLKVFEALSANSKAARIARDMMEGLKECGMRWRAAVPVVQGFQPIPRQMTGPDAAAVGPSPLDVNAMPTPSAWPAEIVDSMAWSSQFFGAVQQKK